MLDLLILRYAQGIEHAHELIRAEETHQIILQRQVEAGFTRVSLTAGTAAQLVIDTPGFMTLCTDDL